MTSSQKIVLASASPRRQELLVRLGVPFEIIQPEGVEESKTAGSGYQRSQSLARLKADAVLARLPGEYGDARVIGADTLISVELGSEERVLEKPHDLEHAREMLRVLSGTTHRVMTGLALASISAGVRLAVEVSLVTFRRLGEDEIETYLRSSEWRGKAGAYAVQGQGRQLVAGIRGCYYNIVGLPLKLLAQMLSVDWQACDCQTHPLQRGIAGCKG